MAPIAADPDLRYMIVVHPRQGSLWDARSYPGTGIVEIRPTRPLADPGPLGWLNGMLDFSRERIESLIQAGYYYAEVSSNPAAPRRRGETDVRR